MKSVFLGLFALQLSIGPAFSAEPPTAQPSATRPGRFKSLATGFAAGCLTTLVLTFLSQPAEDIQFATQTARMFLDVANNTHDNGDPRLSAFIGFQKEDAIARSLNLPHIGYGIALDIDTIEAGFSETERALLKQSEELDRDLNQAVLIAIILHHFSGLGDSVPTNSEGLRLASEFRGNHGSTLEKTTLMHALLSHYGVRSEMRFGVFRATDTETVKRNIREKRWNALWISLPELNAVIDCVEKQVFTEQQYKETFIAAENINGRAVVTDPPPTLLIVPMEGPEL